MTENAEAKSAWIIFRRVMYALVLREISIQGKDNTHISWIIIEPLIHVLFYLVLWSVLSRGDKNGIDIMVYLATGIIPWFMFRAIIARSLNYLDKSLLEFYYIKPFDILLAGILVDIMTYSIIYCLTMCLLEYVGKNLYFCEPLILISCYLSLVSLAIGVSLILMVITAFFRIVKKVITHVLRIMYFTSCVIVPASIIPNKYFLFLYFNPVVHVMEFSRKCVFPSFITPITDPQYMYVSSLVTLFIGLLCYSKYKNLIARTC